MFHHIYIETKKQATNIQLAINNPKQYPATNAINGANIYMAMSSRGGFKSVCIEVLSSQCTSGVVCWYHLDTLNHK